LTAARPVGVSLCHQDQAALRPLSSPERTHSVRRGPYLFLGAAALQSINEQSEMIFAGLFVIWLGWIAKYILGWPWKEHISRTQRASEAVFWSGMYFVFAAAISGLPLLITYGVIAVKSKQYGEPGAVVLEVVANSIGEHLGFFILLGAGAILVGCGGRFVLGWSWESHDALLVTQSRNLNEPTF